jgi:iron-sulfur cluster repair protein YtfE (RIC family)
MAPLERADPIIMGHILAQHRELHELMVAARAAFAVDTASDTTGRQKAREALETLRDHLREHFAQEERGGFLEESVTRMPRLSARGEAVLREHPELLSELDALIRCLARPDSGAPAWDQATRDFEQFARHLLDHERNENAVVQEGYNEDLGLVD